VNIGGEGQIALGGLAAACLALWLGAHALVQPIALLAAIAAGAAWSGLAGFLLAARGVHEVLGTLLLNFVGVLIVAAALHGPLGEEGAGFPQSPLLDSATWLSKPWPGTELHVGLALAVAAALAAQAVLWRSVVGFHWRVLGLAPRAARYAGLHPGVQRVAVMAVGGGFAGLAGGIEVLGVHYRLIEGFSTGFGFTAIAIALAATASPLAAIPAALFFAALETGALAMQRQTGLPSALVLVIEGLALLFVLMAQRGRG
jgi:simple sugar transport system permease protein